MDTVTTVTPAGARRDLQVERVTSGTALARLRPEWDALWTALPDATPFQHSAWLCAWWDAFDGGELRVSAFRYGGRLCGLAPWYLRRNCDGSGELRLMGAGVSDYLDVLVAPEMSSSVVHAMALVLEQSAHEWTWCAFDHLRPGSPLMTMTIPADTVDIRAPDEPCPTLFLPATREDLSLAIGSRMTSNIRHQWHRAERMGRITVRDEQPDSIDAMLDALFLLHGKRWSTKGHQGVLRDARVREFHRQAARGLQRAGILRLQSLSIGSQIAAIYYGFHTPSRDYFYISGFDPSFSSVGPGALVIAAAINRAIAERSLAFDFLGGREPYKYQWGAVDRERVSRHVRRRSARES